MLWQTSKHLGFKFLHGKKILTDRDFFALPPCQTGATWCREGCSKGVYLVLIAKKGRLL
jgi:hypothetical protein